MIKSELVARIAELNPHLPANKAERTVNAVLNRIAEALAAGDRVELRDFGTFLVKPRPARTGRNPQTGAEVTVDAKAEIRFRAGRGLSEQINHQTIAPGKKARPLLKVLRR